MLPSISTLARKARTMARLAPHKRARLMRNRVRETAHARLGPLAATAFHIAEYNSPNTWPANTWLGFPVEQLPSDLLLYQEVVFRTRPGFIIQTGVNRGGSILFLAHLMDLVEASESALVIGIDIHLTPEAQRLAHPRIRLIEGDSTAPAVIEQVQRLVSSATTAGDAGGMVSLDSDHSARHVLREMELYSHFVGLSQYLVVEDTNVNGHPVALKHGPGPHEALETFLPGHPEFAPDDALWQRQMLSHHAGGWLRRRR